MFLLAMLFATSAPVPSQNALQKNNPSVTDKLLEMERQFAKATAERGGEGFASFFAADAVTFPKNGKIATGIPKATWKPEELQLTWQAVKAEVSASGDLGYTYGYYQMRSHTAQGEVSREGKYTTIWRKQPDGSWKVVLDIGNESSNQD